MKKIFLSLMVLVMGIVMIGEGTASAGTTATATATVRVVPSCSISGVKFNFGMYNRAAITAPVGSIGVNCASTVIYRVGIDAGANYNGVTRRLADSAGDFVPYKLCADAPCTVSWGDDFTSAYDLTSLPAVIGGRLSDNPLDTLANGTTYSTTMSGVLSVQNTGSGALQTLPVTGQIAASLTNPVGSYTDVLHVVVLY